MSKKENQEFFIPMIIDEGVKQMVGYNPSKIEYRRIGTKNVKVMLVPCNEEQYHAFMQYEWKEQQRNYRHSKCMITGKSGKLIRCDGDCSKCDKKKDGNDLSYENLKSEVADNVTGDTILNSLLLDSLINQLNEISPEYAIIFNKLLASESTRAIADFLNKPQSTLNDEIKRIRAAAAKLISKEDLLN